MVNKKAEEEKGRLNRLKELLHTFREDNTTSYMTISFNLLSEKMVISFKERAFTFFDPIIPIDTVSLAIKEFFEEELKKDYIFCIVDYFGIEPDQEIIIIKSADIFESSVAGFRSDNTLVDLKIIFKDNTTYRCSNLDILHHIVPLHEKYKLKIGEFYKILKKIHDSKLGIINTLKKKLDLETWYIEMLDKYMDELSDDEKLAGELDNGL